MFSATRSTLIPLYMLLASALFLSACSSDDGSPNTPVDPPAPPAPPGTTTVVLRTGLWPASDGVLLVPRIPEDLDTVTFSVQAGDSTYTATVPVEVGDTVAETTFDLPTPGIGQLSGHGYDMSQTLVYKGTAYRQLTTETDTLIVNMYDAALTTPPVMGGTLTASSPSATEVELEWDAATVGGQPVANATYLIWIQDVALRAPRTTLPQITTDLGQTSLLVSGLNGGTVYNITVMAVDPAGNQSVDHISNTATTRATHFGFYVDAATGVDDADCGDIDDPCRSITKALSLSVGNEPIYIARGRYDADHGEVFPLVLKEGTRLIGHLYWDSPILTTILDVDATATAIEVPISGSIIGLEITYSGEGTGYGIDAHEGEVDVAWTCIKGFNGFSGIRTGAEARIRWSEFVDMPTGKGIYVYGDASQEIIGCIVDNCDQGIAIQGRNKTVHDSLVRNCTTGIYAWSDELIDTGNMDFTFNVLMHNDNAIDFQGVDETLVYYNLVWKNPQTGIKMSGVDETVRIENSRIDESTTGVYVYSGNPVITESILVCSRVNLHVGGSGIVDASQNHWHHHPPIVTNREDDEPCLESDICYDGEYAQTPMPIWEPDRLSRGCWNIAYIPQINLLELPAELDRIRADAGLPTLSSVAQTKWH